jgi:hypothetical protein
MKISFFQIAIILIVIAYFSCSFKDDSTRIELIQLAEKINKEPIALTFKNAKTINNNGGHLQGIQYLNHNEIDYYVMTGSSDTYSYYSIVKLGDENLLISTNKILEKPFKHAGGFQINKNLMAIGVEDNEAKDISKVFVFRIDDPERPPEQPLAIIERNGTTKRATAGCIAITESDEKVLVVVGDWDTAHLDFYSINRDKLGEDGEVFELNYTINSDKMDKTGWSDPNWLSYQNINFIQDKAGRLYLAGITSNDVEENILDLFEIEIQQSFVPKLKKVYSKNFGENVLAKFRWGSGIYFGLDKKLKVVACGENILDVSTIHVYE